MLGKTEGQLETRGFEALPLFLRAVANTHFGRLSRFELFTMSLSHAEDGAGLAQFSQFMGVGRQGRKRPAVWH